MNLWQIGLLVLSRLPVEKFLFRNSSRDKEIKEQKFYEELEAQWQNRKEAFTPTRNTAESVNRPAGGGVTTPETVAYQRRELGKALILLENHLRQKCKIGGKACDCCEKHPLEIEGLAQETLGMTGEMLFDHVAQWARNISSITTESASASGDYDEKYPLLAMEARNLRKSVMGTLDLTALMTPEQEQKVARDLGQILSEGEDNERGRGNEEMRPGRRDMSDGGTEAPAGSEPATGE